MKKSLIYISLLGASTLVGCTKNFDKINTDPNAITTVDAEKLYPGVLRSMSNMLVGQGWGLGNKVIQHTAQYQFVDVDRYIWGDESGPWSTVYNGLRDLRNFETKSTAINQTSYIAINKILKAWMISIVTDLYGDAPYSEAVKGDNGITLPKYDAQSAIYDDILKELKEANTILKTTKTNIAADVIYGGNVMKWRKLANSLRVRYLMRASKKMTISQELNAIISDPTEYPVFTSNDDNAVYKYSAASPNQYPIYGYRTGSFDEVRLSLTMQKMLESFNNDPRIKTFAAPTAISATTDTPKYWGMPNGLSSSDALNYNGGSQYISKINNIWFKESITARGLKVAKGYIMGYPELSFLLAEAKSAGKLTAGNTTAQYYENGIRAAFDYIDVTIPADYLTLPSVALTGTNDLEKIGNQKWVALFNTGFEAWFDWRRTGYPKIQPAVSNQNGGLIPVRLKYPLQEQSLNGKNYQAAVTQMGGDDINTKMWYLK